MKSILQATPIESGDVQVFGRSIRGLSTHQIADLGVASVLEGRQLFGPLSVRENLELGAYGMHSRRERQISITQVLEQFPALKDRLSHRADVLSGGQQQMLAIGRALMAGPKLLMLDEPSLGLAPKLVEELFEQLHRLHLNGLTVLLIEQNAVAALELAQRAYVLEAGEIVIQGKGSELLQDSEVRRSYLGVVE
jgi:branched-chain amino acid transport system ATP-binding protein